MSQTDDVLGSKISNAPENNSFAVSFTKGGAKRLTVGSSFFWYYYSLISVLFSVETRKPTFAPPCKFGIKVGKKGRLYKVGRKEAREITVIGLQWIIGWVPRLWALLKWLHI